MRKGALVVAIACALTLFVGLDTVGYLDQREARDGRVAEELLSLREPLTPVLAREPLFEKPVFGYLPEILTHDRAQESPLRSRLLRAALAVALVVLVGRIAAVHFGARAGITAALVMVTALGLPLAARTDGAQLLATLCAWAAAGGFSVAIFAERPMAAPRLAACHLALAAALLTGGPLSALWPLGGVALYARLAGRREALSRVRPLAALAVMAGLGLPWYGAMLERHGEAFAAHVPFMPYAVEVPGPWYAGAMLAVSFLIVAGFPWSALMPAAFAHAAMRWRAVRLAARSERAGTPGLAGDDARAREEREERAAHFFIALLVASLVPVAIYRGPPLPAALPAIPAMALVCGRFLDHLFEDPARLRSPFGRATLMLGLTGTAAAAAFSMAGTRVTALFPALRWVAPFVLLSGWAPFVVHFFLRRPRIAAALIALPVAVGTPLVSYRLLPELEEFLSARPVAAAMNAVAPERAPLGLLDPPPPSLQLYLAHDPVMLDSLGRDVSKARAADGNVYLAFRPTRERETARRLAIPLEILSRTPTLVLARVRPEATSAAAR